MAAAAGWVEILEPETRNVMFANINSGECQWERPPAGVQVKEHHKDQWWELRDAQSSLSYYYNSDSAATVWARPSNASADILPLEKLQQMQEKLAALDATGDGPAPNTGPPTAIEPSSRDNAIAGLTKKRPSQVDSGLESYQQNLSTHTKGVIFKKKVSLASMLSWSKSAIKKPMLTTLPKADRKDALALFKLVQMYMQDRGAKNKEPIQVALTVVIMSWKNQQLRDELYLQLCKQTTKNDNIVNCEKGWELMCMSVNFVPPSTKFFSYFQGYVSRHTAAAGEQRGRISQYAEHCLKKLAKIMNTGPKRGQKEPQLSEVRQAQKNIFDPSMYGASLEEVMEAQSRYVKNMEIPWVVTCLTAAILDAGGASQEGIFRVPGDIDAVNMLKVKADRGELKQLAKYDEPHIPASALKLWFRELESPLIPAELYDKCILAWNNAEQSIAILAELPSLNRLLLIYACRFLQIIGKPENQPKTKMNLDNLSMVWAPNFLRCPSDDPAMILQNTKKEMHFIRNLLVNLDTSEASHLGLPDVSG